MMGQTFTSADLIGVFALVILEGLLSADNALVLALMVRHLEPGDRKRALMYGLGGAFVFRCLAIAFATWILQFWFLQAIGAGYLLYLPIRHFVRHAADDHAGVKQPGGSLWATVVAVELTDIAFAVDSVLAGVAFINSNPRKLWIVVSGAMIGIVLLRIAAGALVKIMERYPVLDHMAYLLVGWVGVKLAFLAGHSLDQLRPDLFPFEVPQMPAVVFWTVLALIVAGGSFLARRAEVDAANEPKNV